MEQEKKKRKQEEERAAAAELHRQAEQFRVLIGNLQLIVGKYNSMCLTLLDVERPMPPRRASSHLPTYFLNN